MVLLMPELFCEAATLQMAKAPKDRRKYFQDNIDNNLAGLDLTVDQRAVILDHILSRNKFKHICPFLKGIMSFHPAQAPETLKEEMTTKVNERYNGYWKASTLSKETYAEWCVWSAYCNPDEWMAKEESTSKFYKLCPLLDAIKKYSTTETMEMHKDFVEKIKRRYESLWYKRSVSKQTYKDWNDWLNKIGLKRRRLQSGDNAPHRLYAKRLRLIQRLERMGLLPTDHLR